jgi:hypothetical protein
MQEYLTKEHPYFCLYDGPHERFTKDDRLVMRRFVYNTKLPESLILIQPIWKFYHALGLELADELQLGPIDMKWLILNQNTFRVAGLTQMQFVQRARRWHEKRIRLNRFDNGVLIDIMLLYYQAYGELSQAIRGECLTQGPGQKQRLDEQLRPDSNNAQGQLLESFSTTQVSTKNDNLLSAVKKTSEFDTLAIQEYEEQDPGFNIISHHMRTRRIEPYGALEAKLSPADS